MKFLILLLFAVLCQASVGVLAQDEEENQMEEHWLEVPLDHFNLFDNRTWQMRYIVNLEFFKPGKPLFVYIGGEAEIDTSMLQAGQLYRLAKKHQGMIVTNEHRYYGQSLPFGKDFKPENLKYLQIEQALEDLAYFIEHFKSSIKGLENSIVVAHGCSYPGMLATWIRLRFPHIVDISYASSAPLGVGLDYPEFFQIVHDAYANFSTECADTIKKGFNQTQELMKTKLGLRTVKNALRDWGCGDIEAMNSAKIIQKMVGVLNIMYDPEHYEELGCLVLSIDDLSAFHKLANFITVKSLDRNICQDAPDPTGLQERNGIAWGYQTCTEMGTFQTLDRKDSRNPFEMDISLQESVDECIKRFGGMVTEDVLKNGIDRVTRRYGGKRPKVTKVVTAQGTHDPWKHLAVLEDYNPQAPVFLVRGSHCVDISESDDDSEELQQVRTKIRDVVSKWIEEIS